MLLHAAAAATETSFIFPLLNCSLQLQDYGICDVSSYLGHVSARFATMGGGNGQKSATARARKQAEADAQKAWSSGF